MDSESGALYKKPSSEDLDSKSGLIINLMPNSTSTAFIAGLGITVRELRFPLSAVNAWLGTYRSKIDRAARRCMKDYPPREKCMTTLCLSLTEFVTETWRTIFIRTGPDPSPVILIWKTGPRDYPGAWHVLELPQSRSVISGGMGSVPVSFLITNSNGLKDRTKWTFASDGVLVGISSGPRWLLCSSCFSGSSKHELNSLQPVSPPPRVQEK